MGAREPLATRICGRKQRWPKLILRQSEQPLRRTAATPLVNLAFRQYIW